MPLRRHDLAPSLHSLTLPDRSLRDQSAGVGKSGRNGTNRGTIGATIVQIPQAQRLLLRHDLDDHLCCQIQLPLLLSSSDPTGSCRYLILASSECGDGAGVGLLHSGRFHYLSLF